MDVLKELLSNSLAVAGALAPITMGLIQLVKPMLTMDKKYLPPLSILVAVVFALLIGVATSQDLVIYTLAGVIGGLGASGLYDHKDVAKK